MMKNNERDAQLLEIYMSNVALSQTLEIVKKVIEFRLSINALSDNDLKAIDDAISHLEYISGLYW